MGPAWCRYFGGLTSDRYVRHEPSRVQARSTEQTRVQQKWGRNRDDHMRPKTNVQMGGRAQRTQGRSIGTVAKQKPGVTALNMLMNNDWNCLWQEHPAQPYRPFEARTRPSPGGLMFVGDSGWNVLPTTHKAAFCPRCIHSGGHKG